LPSVEEAGPSTGFSFGRGSSSHGGGGGGGAAGNFGGGVGSLPPPTQTRRSLVRSQAGQSVDALAGHGDRPIWEQASVTMDAPVSDGGQQQQQQPAPPRKSLRERLGQPGPDTAVPLGGKKKLTWVAPGLEERERREAAGQPMREPAASRIGRGEGGDSTSRREAASMPVRKKKPSWMTPEMEAEQAAALGQQQSFVGGGGGGGGVATTLAPTQAKKKKPSWMTPEMEAEQAAALGQQQSFVGGGGGGGGAGSSSEVSAMETPVSKDALLNARATRFAPQARLVETERVAPRSSSVAVAPHGAIEDDSRETTFEGAIAGTCDEMCPDEERISRVQQVRTSARCTKCELVGRCSFHRSAHDTTDAWDRGDAE
jgi:hypothetical protein